MVTLQEMTNVTHQDRRGEKEKIKWYIKQQFGGLKKDQRQCAKRQYQIEEVHDQYEHE